jgi:hypothetical protein
LACFFYFDLPLKPETLKMNMLRLALISLLLISAPLAYAANEHPDGAYGENITLSEPVTIHEAISNFEQYQGKEILISGKVAKVCQQKGCWLTLQSSQGDVRMTFKDYGFFVPDSLVDQQVLAQGELHQETMSIAQVKHYAMDAGLPQEEIDKIDRPLQEYRFVASAVRKMP